MTTEKISNDNTIANNETLFQFPPSPEPAVIEVVGGLLGVLLLLELDVDIPHQVVAEVVAHVHLLNLGIGEKIEKQNGTTICRF